MTREFLIVDDSPVIRRTLEKMLRRFGSGNARISTAADSQQALKEFRDKRPDVVLLDIQLPDVGGEQTARVMFNEDPSTRIVAITGLMEEDQRVRDLLSMGAFSLLTKPIHSSDVEELLRLLEEEESGAGRIR